MPKIDTQPIIQEINSDLKSIYELSNATISVEKYPTRVQVTVESPLIRTLTFSILYTGTIRLDHIDLKESARGKGLSKKILTVLEDAAKKFGTGRRLLINRPYNKEYWEHYYEVKSNEPPIVNNWNADYGTDRMARVAASLRELSLELHNLIQKSTQDRRQRASKCNSILSDFDAQQGVATFMSRCTGSSNYWEQTLGFRDYDLMLKTFGKKRGELDFDEFLELAQENSTKLRALLRCDCPDFSYAGFAYILHNTHHGWEPEVNAPPTIKNPENRGALCKHLIAVINNFLT